MIQYQHRQLIFKIPSGTSRGILKAKDSWFLQLSKAGKIGIGECSIIKGLSMESPQQVTETLNKIAQANIENISLEVFQDRPAIKFALEMAMKDLESKPEHILFPSAFTENTIGIPINGLVWMGDKQYMYDQILQKINNGYRCIKIKIAAINFNDEIALLKYIRQHFSSAEIEIRVDANGGFDVSQALEKLKVLSEYDLHSIEQPIAIRQYNEMSRLCELSPIDIALDEELIGVTSFEKKEEMLKAINPQYIILKPSLVGGFKASEEWISLAEKFNVGWWITSALEANIGLNAIAQWAASLNTTMYQGLGTGQLFTNNVDSPLYIEEGHLYYGQNSWQQIFAE